MPGSKTVDRQARKAERRYLRNKSVRSLSKTLILKAEGLIFSGELERGREAVVAANSTLDKVAEKGVIHRNNAARRKSRLMKKLNEALSSSSSKETEAKK